MQPSTIDYQKPTIRPRRFRFAFTLCGIGCGILATLFMAADNLVLWGPPGSHFAYCYPITYCILHFGPVPALLKYGTPGHPTLGHVLGYAFWIVVLGGPLLEWTSWGVIIDVVRAKIAARRFGRAA
jgi:hypothetical protein